MKGVRTEQGPVAGQGQRHTAYVAVCGIDTSQAITKCLSQGTHRCTQISGNWCALRSILYTLVYAVYCVVQLLCAIPANHGSRGFLSEHGLTLTLGHFMPIRPEPGRTTTYVAQNDGKQY